MKLRGKTAGLFGILAIVLFGCQKTETMMETAAKPAVYETDAAEALLLNTEQQWDLIPMAKVNKILYYSTNRTVSFPDQLSNGTITSSVDSSEIPAQDNQSNFGEGFDYRYGTSREELYIKINDTWELFESRRLTLDRLLTLAKKKNLTWSDFDGYACDDIGSGLYILKYDIAGDEFFLIIEGTGTGTPMYIRLVSAANQENFLDIGTENIQEEAIEQFIQKNTQSKTFVGITAHIKEFYGTSMLISSDTDDFPGTFLIDEVNAGIISGEFNEEEGLKGGMNIHILMQNSNKTDNQKIPLYHAERIVVLEENTQTAQEDILLTAVPEFALTDPLSSQYQPFSIPSGNYSWTVEENGEEKTITACGAAPLESLDNAKRLTLPNYKMESILYMFSTKIPPDILTVRQWDYADIQRTDTAEHREESITAYYCQEAFLELKKGKVYEFTAEWKKKNMQKNKFCATASYVLITD